MSIQIDVGIAKFLWGLKIQQTSPFPQRASEAAQARSISLEQARAHAHLDRFELGGNRFQIFPASDFNNPESTALVVSHFGSVFKCQTIGIYISDSFVTLKAAKYSSDFSLTLYSPGSTARELFNLNFRFHNDHIEMSNLRSEILGKGGLAQFALYNVAKASGFRVIKYCVRGGNLPAQRFYAQMGFGVPMDPRGINWEVKVES